MASQRLKFLNRLLGEGASVILTDANGGVDTDTDREKPILLKTLVQINGDVMTFATAEVLERPELMADHYKRATAALNKIKNLRRWLDGAFFLGLIPMFYHGAAVFMGDWREQLWRNLPFTVSGLLVMCIRPLVISYVKRKIPL